MIFLFFLSSDMDAQRIRRLLIFSNDSTNVQMKAQRALLEADKQGVEQRDIWIAVFHDPKTFRRMYEHYDVGRADFFLILVDKDGEEKIRSEELVPLKDLFGVIDGTVIWKEEDGG